MFKSILLLLFKTDIQITANDIEITLTEVGEKRLHFHLNICILRKDQQKKINFSRKYPCIYSLLSKYEIVL